MATDNTEEKFERKISNRGRLISNGFVATNNDLANSKKLCNQYLRKIYEDKTVIFTSQSGLQKYMKSMYNIDLFRCPSEAYIIEYNDGRKVMKIIDKKVQNEGAIGVKLWSVPSLKREYELMLNGNFEIQYALCVNKILEKKLLSSENKYTVLKTIFEESKIDVLFGDDEYYFEILDGWLKL